MPNVALFVGSCQSSKFVPIQLRRVVDLARSLLAHKNSVGRASRSEDLSPGPVGAPFFLSQTAELSFESVFRPNDSVGFPKTVVRAKRIRKEGAPKPFSARRKVVEIEFRFDFTSLRLIRRRLNSGAKRNSG